MIKEMFMVNRVKFAIFDHIYGVSEFKDRDTSWLKKARETRDKVIDVVYMSDHVVGNDHIGELALARQLFGASRPEEFMKCRHANGVCSRYRPVGRVDTETVNSTVDE